MPLEHDMIGLYLAVGNANHLPAWGGLDMLLSTNPIAVAVPAGEEPPIVLDMATTVAAYGKVKTKAQRGETMPEGWMMDRQGRPLTDPKRANEGFLLPIGGYKGYGLALIFGLLAGHAERRGDGPGRGGLQRRRHDAHQHRARHRRDQRGGVPAGRGIQEERGRAGARHPRLASACRAWIASGCPARAAMPRAPSGSKNGIPLPAPLAASLNQLAAELKITPLA